MGSGYSKLYSGAYQGKAVPGSIDYMNPNDNFSQYIRRRSDIDPDGWVDIIAHGSSNTIQVFYKGIELEINHRTAIKLFKQNKDFKDKNIRLLSCDTGSVTNSGKTCFAQNLANKLGVIVEAPTKWVWALPSGRYFVAGVKNGEADLNNRGKFIKFYPGGNKK